MSDNEGGQVNKYHHKKKTKKKQKTDENDNEGEEERSQENAKARNPKAFSFQSHVAAERKFRR